LVIQLINKVIESGGVVMVQDEEQEVKTQLYDQFALIGKALGSARRLELIDLLAQSECTVEKLAEESNMSVANTSQHLRTLRAARLVDVRREGVVAYYRLSDEAVFLTWQMIRELGEACIAEIDWLTSRLFEGRDYKILLPFTELLALLEGETVAVVDVRPQREYKAGHIQGACSIPLKELPSRLQEIDKDKAVVVYCRGPYSTLADKAVKTLLTNGYSVRRLEQGFPEWRAEGLPVESGLELLPSP
jgi:rhodanese-related sulfurtransferase/predicted transcriptional regulator